MGNTTSLQRAAYRIPKFVMASVDLNRLGQHDDALFLKSAKFQSRLFPWDGGRIVVISVN